ncbi:hypothetical protein [Bosea lathyri]|uniref:Uncharacterized protein n=1 Tax=Bosea lathyri TaxID=1036778 RepID=A0A1H6D4I3_9HYPH|nr:hypothetical protein [Bosea lathyri]SEG79723.1 hypothetical protein SAMN04488115_1159 [Bosea lathyri]
MTNLASNFNAFGRVPAGWRGAGLAFVAGVLMSAAGALPSSAAPLTDWKAACTFATMPQGPSGDAIRYGYCLRQWDCHRLANAEGRTVFELGCFGVAPDAPAIHSSARSYR